MEAKYKVPGTEYSEVSRYAVCQDLDEVFFKNFSMFCLIKRLRNIRVLL